MGSLFEKNTHTLSQQELIDIRDTIDTPVFDKDSFDDMAEDLNYEKQVEKKSGLHATLAMPLFMLLSVRVKPRGGVYGGITCHRSFIYNREYFYKTDINNAEEFGCDGGYLTLNGPPRLCMSEDACHLHASRKLSIELSDKSGGILAAGCIDLFCSQNEFEEVKDSVVDMGKLSLHLKYVSIPMAIYGRLEFGIFNKPFLRRVNLREYVNVCGKVVATYKNTFGDYKSQEIVVFEKNSDEYERVVIDSSSNLLFPRRCWVAVPAYSLLHLHIDLFEFRTNKTILKEDVELETKDAYGFSKKLIGPEFVIIVSASWFLSQPVPQCADDSGQGESEDGGEVDGVQIRTLESRPSFIRALEVEGPRLRNFGGFEVFSVLICYKGCMTLKIHGHLLLSASSKIVIFKKDEEDALSLSGKGNTIPVLGGSRLYDDAFPFALSCDLKDTLGNLRIKGYERWRSGELFSGGQKLCSVFRGDNGFAAMHYAIFRYAAQANLKVFYTESGLKSVGLPVFGSFYVRYNNFDYSSYDKNCYRVVLFKRIGKEDSVPVDANGLIPLSRSSVVVSQYSSYVFDLHFVIGARKFSGIGNLKFGTSSISIKVDECVVKIDLEWSEVK